MTLVPRNQRVGDEIWGNEGISEQGGLVVGGGGGFKANPLGMGHVFLGMRSARGRQHGAIHVYAGGKRKVFNYCG